MPQIILSTVGLSWAYEAARAASQAGYLKRFIVGINNPRETGFDPDTVRTIILPNYIGYAVQQFPHPGSIYFSYLLRDNLFDLMARRQITDCDIFHGWNHMSLYSLRRAKQLGAKVIIDRASAHPITQYELLKTEFENFGVRYPASARWLIKKHVQEFEEADAIFVASEFIQRTMLEQGVPPEKLKLLHLGFNPERFQPGTPSDDVFRILFVGLIGLRKGVHYLLEAFKRLNLPDAELVLVGGLSSDARLFLPQYKGLYRHIPFVPQEELKNLYHSASVFVLPSIEEGFGMVVAEAAASGLPLIISENVGAAVRDGQDGFVIPIRDVDALAERLLTLYNDPSLRRQMGLSAHEYIQRFTWQTYHEQLVNYYHQLAP